MVLLGQNKTHPNMSKEKYIIVDFTTYKDNTASMCWKFICKSLIFFKKHFAQFVTGILNHYYGI